MAKTSGGGVGGTNGRGGGRGVVVNGPVAPVVTPAPIAPITPADGIVQPRFGVGKPDAPATPFTQMPAFKKLGTEREAVNNVTTGDAYLESLIADQGWADPKLRTVTTSKNVDDAIAAGAVALYRTVKPANNKTANQLLDDLRSGDIFGGYGIYGNGTYTATDFAHSKTTYGRSYGGGSETVRMALKPGARIVDWNDLNNIARQNAAYHATLNTPRINGKSVYRPLANLANLAVWLGYDVIRQPAGNGSRTAAQGGHDYYNILNPTALIIEDINMGQAKTGYNTANTATTRTPRARKIP